MDRSRALSAAGVLVVLAITTACQSGGSDTAQPSPRPQTPSTRQSDAWPGPVRPGVSLPVLRPDRYLVTDASDVANGAVDILRVQPGVQRLSWMLRLREGPNRGLPELRTSEARYRAEVPPLTRTVAYGVVVDGDGDGVADCELGISDEPPGRANYRVWVSNLTTGVEDDRSGPPYGFPFEFTFPESPTSVGLSFFFLTKQPEPCAPFRRSGGYYAWAVLKESGTPIAWDFAPDAAWFHLHDKQAAIPRAKAEPAASP